MMTQSCGAASAWPPPATASPSGSSCGAASTSTWSATTPAPPAHDLAEDDQVLEPARDVEEPLLVHEAEVAGAQPAAGQQDPRRRLGVVVVAAHDPGALDADLALLARRELGP